MPGNKKNTRGKKYRPKRVSRPFDPLPIVRPMLDDLGTLEMIIYEHLHKGACTIEELWRARDYMYNVLFILSRRSEQFDGYPVEKWITEVRNGCVACSNATERAFKNEKATVVCTGEEIKTIEGIVREVFPFLVEQLETAPQVTAFDVLACAKVIFDILHGKAGTTIGGRKVFQRYYENVIQDWQLGKLENEYARMAHVINRSATVRKIQNQKEQENVGQERMVN